MVSLQDILKSGKGAGILSQGSQPPMGGLDMDRAPQSTSTPKNAIKVNNYGYPNLPLNTLITVANGAITQKTEQQVLQNLQKQKLQQLSDYVAILATH
jgi:hypothetical protein